MGYQDLNCDGFKNDPQYANHDKNSQYIKPNRDAYNAGQQQFGTGRRIQNCVTRISRMS
ncbi:hypothetical protein BVI2075_70101 [Burkholderia vietnamiensis]|nr:hypothetical protein BVI2075_70101 [Burkholderia vietnamiensis]CAG9222304.1 hypothetical protein BVI1335_400063 [Burkholderia vietnamiensis]